MKSTQRILCLWFPNWPIQRLLANHPAWQCSVLLIVEQTHRGEFVSHGNEVAGKRGIRPGMPLSEARSLLRSGDTLVVEPVRPHDDKIALGKLALRCEAYSPHIGLEDTDRPECLWMDVTGIDHFFSGERPLAEQLEQAFHQAHYQVRIAITNTTGSAWAAAHFLAGTRCPAVIESTQFNSLLQLPVTGLRLEPADLKKLRRLGIETIQQLLNLERSSLRSRFGNELLVRIDQFTGARLEWITPYVSLPRFHVEQSLEEGLKCPEIIEQLSFMLLEKLLDQLREKRLGTRHLHCRFVMENQSVKQMSVRLCDHTNDTKQIAELLRLQLAKLRIETPLVQLQIEALQPSPIVSTQLEQFTGKSRDHAVQYRRLMNRLSSQLGEQAIVHSRLSADPIPERAVELIPVTEQLVTAVLSSTQNLLPHDRPTALFTEPRQVEVTVVSDGPPLKLFWKGDCIELVAHHGPERIESGWWLSSYVRRDYYWVETVEGRWLWLFKRLQDQHWFWHGEVL